MAPSPAAVRLKPFATGAEPIAPVVGEDGFLPAIPLDEPLSVGPPPVRPGLVRRVEAGFALRGVRCRSGHLVTSSLATAGRPRWAVSWRGLTLAQRNLLRDFLVRDPTKVCTGGDGGGGLQAFDLDVDGTGTGSVAVRPVAAIEETHFTRRGGDVAAGEAGGGVYDLESVIVEEVF